MTSSLLSGIGTGQGTTPSQLPAPQRLEKDAIAMGTRAGLKALHGLSGMAVRDGEDDFHLAALDTAVSIMHADGGCLHVGATGPRLVAARNLDATSLCFWESIALSPNEFCGRALIDGERRIVADIALLSEPGDAEYGAHWRLNGIVAMQSTPLITRQGGIIGLLTTFHHTPCVPPSTDLLLLDLLARQIADGYEQDHLQTVLHETDVRLNAVISELQHRVRNILAVIRSVFSLTVANGGDLRTIIDHFSGRLDALARTQLVVTRSITGSVDLETLVRDELLGAGVHDGPTILIRGPDVALPPTVAETLGLVLHELTTNAVKYGALAQDGAVLDVGWRLTPAPGEKETLELCWRETGVADISGHDHAGFGRELIEQALPYRLGGRATLRIGRDGVQCRIAFPLPMKKS